MIGHFFSPRFASVFLRALIVVCALFVSVLVPLQAQATSTATPDQGNLSPLEFAGSLDVVNMQSLGAPFVPSESGPLARLDLSLQRTEHTFHDLTIQIFSATTAAYDSNEFLESIDFQAPLGTVTLRAQEITTESSVKTVVFEPAIELTANETYVILLSSEADPFTDQEEYFGWSTLQYESGDSGVFAYRAGNDVPFVTQIPQELAFTTYVGEYAAEPLPELPSLDGMENLISTYGSVTNSDGLMGVIGHEFNDGEYSSTSLGVDESATAQDVDCQGQDVKNILCDPAETTNDPQFLTQGSIDAGYGAAPACPFDEEPGWCYEDRSYVVIDLGQLSEFSAFEVFQMHNSWGMVSDAELLTSSNTTSQSPINGDDSWSLVASGSISEGIDQTEADSGYVNDAVTRFDFAPVQSRYVMLVFQNDGSLSQDQFIQVAGVKLFGSRVPPAVANEFVTFDCDAPILEEKNYFLLPNRTLSISYSNCDDMLRGMEGEERVSTGTSEIVIPWSELSDETATNIDFVKAGMENDYVTWNFYQAVEDPSTPALELHSIEEMPLNLSGIEHLVNVATPNIGECNVDVGAHSFSESTFTVQNSGDVRATVIATTPSTDSMTRFHNTQAENDEMSNLLVADTFMVIYSDFDPAHPESNVLGCNDDRNTQRGTMYDGVVLATGWSDVTVSLEPGTYTLVLMAWNISSQNQNFGVSIFSSALPTSQTADVGLWGQSGVFASVNSQPSAPNDSESVSVALVHTGLNYIPIMLLALIAVTVGFGFLVIRKRRNK